jgi:hypothetical protein
MEENIKSAVKLDKERTVGNLKGRCAILTGASRWQTG